MATKAETLIVNRILSEFRERGIWCYKSHGGEFQAAGLPDIIACHNSVFVGIEVKRPGHKATALQQLVITRIKAAGGIAGVATSVDGALALLEEAL